MSEGDPDDVRIVGRSREAVVSAIVDVDVHANQFAVREALDAVTEDGLVTRDAVDDALADLATVVATTENRVEFAAIALEEAREAAEPVSYVTAVAAQLDAFDERLSAIEAEVGALGDDLQALLGRVAEEGEDVTYGVARRIHRIEDEADDLQAAADELTVDVEEFDAWLADPAVRAEEFEADVEALEETLAVLEETADALQTEEGDPPVGSTATEQGDRGTRWASATVDHRVAGLMLAELRAELADLRTMAERVETDAAGPLAATADRLDDLVARHEEVGDALESIDAPDWHARYDERIATVEETLESFEPPVDWAELQAALEGVEGEAGGRGEPSG